MIDYDRMTYKFILFLGLMCAQMSPYRRSSVRRSRRLRIVRPDMVDDEREICTGKREHTDGEICHRSQRFFIIRELVPHGDGYAAVIRAEFPGDILKGELRLRVGSVGAYSLEPAALAFILPFDDGVTLRGAVGYVLKYDLEFLLHGAR